MAKLHDRYMMMIIITCGITVTSSRPSVFNLGLQNRIYRTDILLSLREIFCATFAKGLSVNSFNNFDNRCPFCLSRSFQVQYNCVLITTETNLIQETQQILEQHYTDFDVFNIIRQGQYASHSVNFLYQSGLIVFLIVY